MNMNSIVKSKQQPLIENYNHKPQNAWITDVATIEGTNLEDPFHTSVVINNELKVLFPVGVHSAVGGLHDAPNPGDLLCASLAACFESTLRMVANRLHVQLLKTKVKALAHVDVRGTLMIDKEVPVAFQNMSLKVEIEHDKSNNEELINKLLQTTEHCCIIYQTIKIGIPVYIETKIKGI